MRLPGLCALLIVLGGCSGYEVRCTGPLRPINAANSSTAAKPAASRTDIPTVAAP
jgi:hypothetical protein